MNCIAHLGKGNEERIEQSLKEHCSHTAEYASACLKDIGLYYVAFLSGMLHDMGKATKVFNEYLENAFKGEETKKGSVIHSYTGAIYILESYHKNSSYEMLTSEIIGYAIGAHHGLFDCVDLNDKNGFDKRLYTDKDEIFYKEAVENYFKEVLGKEEIEQLFYKAVEEVKRFYERGYESISVTGKEKKKVLHFQVGLLARLVTSAVIYGDRRDTREFMQGKGVEVRAYNTQYEWKKTAEVFETKISEFSTETQLNKMRQKISEQCFKFAQRETGIYRLNVPTGAGKTLATLRYALEHAKRFEKKRIIFIIPLLSVIDQNAKVLREYLKDNDLILEHHSNVINEKSENKKNEDKESEEELECLQEDWNDSPIVISTLVQILEILFSHKTSAISRMQALSDSVIVFDEIQSLPKKVTEMFNVAMNFLKTHCNTTIVLSSATQPCLENVEWPIELADNPDMVRLSRDELKVFDRADIIDTDIKYGMTNDELEEFCENLMIENNSLLVICNTRAEARELFYRLNDKGNDGWEVFHLSTSMCQMHRVHELTKIQQRLSDVQKNITGRKKVICVATQLVEAGIDFSFQCVVRVLAGLDNLTQAAGRCNRSNEYLQKGKVYFVKIKNEKLSNLEEIKVAQNSAIEVITNKDLFPDKNIIGEQAIHNFYRGVFASMKKEIKYPSMQSKHSLSRLLANEGQEQKKYYMNQPFKTVAKEFKVFDNETVDIIVPYGRGKELIKQLNCLESHGKIWELQQMIKEAKTFTISVYKPQIKKLLEYGWLDELFEGGIMILKEEMYSEKCGLEPIVQQSVESYIF